MKNKILYEMAISSLAIVAVVFVIMDINKGLNQQQIIIDNVIYAVFILDYIIRLLSAKGRFKFIRENIFDLIAIIPFNAVFRIFRAIKLIKLVRIAKLSKLFKLSRFIAYSARLFKKAQHFFNTNGLKYVLLICFSLILIGAITIHYIEGIPLLDGIWWAFVTITTVGYGDISPVSAFGRIVAMLLMLSGIGLIGSLTSAITSYFFTKKKHDIKNDTIENIKARLDDIVNLSDDEIDLICSILKTLNK